MKKNMLGD